jgi:hypothetical protein
VEELPHAGSAKSHTSSEGFTLTEFEVSDGLLRESDGRFLTRDLGDFDDGIIDGHFAVWGFAHAGGYDDFFKPWDLMWVGVSELLFEVRNYLIFVVLQ